MCVVGWVRANKISIVLSQIINYINHLIASSSTEKGKLVLTTKQPPVMNNNPLKQLCYVDLTMYMYFVIIPPIVHEIRDILINKT